MKKHGKKVILQTVPPFNYGKERKEKWLYINNYIKNNISKEADTCFDCCTVLSKSKDEPEKTIYGPHPDNDGGKVWAEALYEFAKNIIV